jgi:Mor family transcriptional regulator
MPLPDSYPETLRDLADCIEQTLGQIAADPAADPALVIVEALRFRFGGSLLYIPKGDKMDRATRDAELCAAFTGRNHRELSRRYGLTVSQVYGIIAAHRKAP